MIIKEQSNSPLANSMHFCHPVYSFFLTFACLCFFILFLSVTHVKPQKLQCLVQYYITHSFTTYLYVSYIVSDHRIQFLAMLSEYYQSVSCSVGPPFQWGLKLTTIGLTDMKCCTDIPGPQSMNCNNCNSLTQSHYEVVIYGLQRNITKNYLMACQDIWESYSTFHLINVFTSPVWTDRKKMTAVDFGVPLKFP